MRCNDCVKADVCKHKNQISNAVDTVAGYMSQVMRNSTDFAATVAELVSKHCQFYVKKAGA